MSVALVTTVGVDEFDCVPTFVLIKLFALFDDVDDEDDEVDEEETVMLANALVKKLVELEDEDELGDGCISKNSFGVPVVVVVVVVVVALC